MGFFSGAPSDGLTGFFGQGKPPANEGLSRELTRLEGIADVSDPSILERAGGGALTVLDKTLDIVGRPLFAIAGFTDNLVNDGGNIGSALQRAGTEFFSGLGGLRGSKETFGRVLADANVSEGGSASELPFLQGLFNDTGEGWKFAKGGIADPTLRGAAGFGLDIALDPISYLSFGTGRAAIKLLQSPALRKSLAASLGKTTLKTLASKGKVPLTRRGLIEFTKQQGQNLPKANREALESMLRDLGETTGESVERLVRELPEEFDARDVERILGDALPRVDRVTKWTPEKILEKSFDVTQAADRTAADSALRSVVRMADEGANFIDPGGVKFFGKTIVAGDKFRPIAARATDFTQRLAETPLGAQFATLGRGIDAIFSETRAAARSIPGFRQARATFRQDVRLRNDNTTKTVNAMLPKAWRKAKVGDMSLHKYLIRHLRDPRRYPAESMPLAVQEQLESFKGFFMQMARDESAAKSMRPGAFPANYVPIMLRNGRKEIEKFVEAANTLRGRPNQTDDILNWREVLAFDDFDEMENIAAQLKKEGLLDFTPKPIEDLEELMKTRGTAHNQMMGLDEFQIQTMKNLGVDSDTVASELADKTFPGLRAAVDAGMDAIDPSKLGRALAQIEPDISKLNPNEKSLLWMGKLRSASSLEDAEKILRQQGDVIAEAAPGLPNQIYEQIGLRKMEYLGSFNEPMQIVQKGAFKGTAWPTAIADELTSQGNRLIQNRDALQMLKIYDGISNNMRMLLTSAFPAFHNRNAMSNTARNFVELGLDAINPVSIARAALIWAGKDGTAITRGGRRYTYSEFRMMAKKFGTIPPSGAISEVVEDGLRRDTLTGKIQSIARVPGNLIETPARMQIFVKKVLDGMDPIEAASRVNRALVDYGELSEAERGIMRRLFLFPKWMRENVERSARELLTEPGRVVTTLKPAIVGAAGPDADMLPEYKRGDFKVKMDSRNSDGKIFVTGIDLPFAAAIEQVFGDSGANFLKKNISSMNPFITLAGELASGRDLFTGRSIEEAKQVRVLGQMIKAMPKPTQDYLEFRETVGDDGSPQYTMNGTKAHIIMKAFGISRFIGTPDAFNRVREEEGINAALIDMMTGIDVAEFDLKEQDERMMRARVKRLEKELKRKGVVRTFERTFVPKGSPEREELDRRKETSGGFFGR